MANKKSSQLGEGAAEQAGSYSRNQKTNGSTETPSNGVAWQATKIPFFSQLGNVTRVSRIDPDKMPSHHVKTKCQLPSSEDTTHLRRRYNRQYKKPGHLPSLPASSKLLPTPPSIPPMPTIDDIVFPLATTSHSGITPSDSFDEAGLTMVIQAQLD